jgi:hypothetical protein
MFARHTRSIAIVAVAALAALLPSTALAEGVTESLSAVDAVSTDVATDGIKNSTSTSTSSSSSDSPTSSVYGQTQTELPPPVTCVPSTTGTDSSGKPATDTCAPTTTVVKTEKPVTKPVTTPVTGGGEVPEVGEPVSGGGDPLPVPAEVDGGGGPELPFTGLPLMYAIYAGFALMLLGGGIWLRARSAGRG